MISRRTTPNATMDTYSFNYYAPQRMTEKNNRPFEGPFYPDKQRISAMNCACPHLYSTAPHNNSQQQTLHIPFPNPLRCCELNPPASAITDGEKNKDIRSTHTPIRMKLRHQSLCMLQYPIRARSSPHDIHDISIVAPRQNPGAWQRTW